MLPSNVIPTRRTVPLPRSTTTPARPGVPVPALALVAEGPSSALTTVQPMKIQRSRRGALETRDRWWSWWRSALVCTTNPPSTPFHEGRSARRTAVCGDDGTVVGSGGHSGSWPRPLTVAGQRRTCTGFPHRPIGTPIDRPSRTSEPVTPIPMRTIAGAMPRVQRSDSEADLRVLRPFRCAPTSASLGDDRREVVRSVTLHAVAGTVDHDHLRRRIAAMEFGHIGVGDHG